MAVLLVLGCAGERERRLLVPLAERMEVLAGQVGAPQGQVEPPCPTKCPGKRPDGSDTRCATGAWQITDDCMQGLPCGGGPIKLMVVLGKDGNIMASGGLDRPVYGIGLWYSDPDFPDEGSALVVNLDGSQQDASEGKPWRCVGQFWSNRRKGPHRPSARSHVRNDPGS